MATVLLVPELEADIRALPHAMRRDVLKALGDLAEDPEAGRPIPLGENTLRELRVGAVRLVYEVRDAVVRVLALSDRAFGHDARPDERLYAWDTFLSYSHADSNDLARSLAEALTQRGLRVWHDQFDLQPGSSLRRSITDALARSAHAVVILSPAFLKQAWPTFELRALAAREARGERVIIPVWHEVTAEDVARFAPPLADRLAIVADTRSTEQIADAIDRAIRGSKSSDPG